MECVKQLFKHSFGMEDDWSLYKCFLTLIGSLSRSYQCCNVLQDMKIENETRKRRRQMIFDHFRCVFLSVSSFPFPFGLVSSSVIFYNVFFVAPSVAGVARTTLSSFYFLILCDLFVVIVVRRELLQQIVYIVRLHW